MIIQWRSIHRQGLGKCLWGELTIPPRAILEPLRGLPCLPTGGTQCLGWHLHPLLLAWLHVTAHQQTQQWPPPRRESPVTLCCQDKWRSEAAWKQSWAYTFLSWTWDCLQLWHPLGAASIRYSRSHLEHLIISGGADLCLTQHLQKVSHKPWQLLGGQRTCTVQDCADTGTHSCLDMPASASFCQLLPAPVHLKQLIRSKHNTAGFSEPDLLPCICFIFFCSCVPHNMIFILFNLLEFLASVYSITRMVCMAPLVGKNFSKLL